MTGRVGVDKEVLPPVRPDCSQQLHPFIFMYCEENLTNIFDSPLSVRCRLELVRSHEHPGF
jgi:hypothetical protein